MVALTQYRPPRLGVGARVSAFPGAQGFGTQTPAGRGGKVYAVSNLYDSGPGSLRAALEADGPRIVVFKVAGVIALDPEKFIRITDPRVSVYGQTAPGQGVEVQGREIKNNMVITQTDDVLFQHVRFRIGPFTDPHSSGSNNVQIAGNRQVFDHCSMSFSMDQIMNSRTVSGDFTLSHCLFSEPLHQSHATVTHRRGVPLGYGPLLYGTDGARISVHHNIFSHCRRRNPAFGGQTVDARNNLVYNHDTGMFFQYSPRGNAIGNLFINGPDTGTGRNDLLYADQAFEDGRGQFPGNLRTHFVCDNIREREGRYDPASYANVARRGIPFTVLKPSDFSQAEVSADPVTTHAAGDVEDILTTVRPSGAGALPGRRDGVDDRQISDIKNRAGQWVDCAGRRTPSDRNNNCARNAPWPVIPYVQGNPLLDAAEVDCVPAEWKIRSGGALVHGEHYDTTQFDSNNDGYTDFEDYLAETFGF